MQTISKNPDAHRLEWSSELPPDGQRFVFDKPVEDLTKATITLVVNWAAGLKK